MRDERLAARIMEAVVKAVEVAGHHEDAHRLGRHGAATRRRSWRAIAEDCGIRMIDGARPHALPVLQRPRRLGGSARRVKGPSGCRWWSTATSTADADVRDALRPRPAPTASDRARRWAGRGSGAGDLLPDERRSNAGSVAGGPAVVVLEHYDALLDHHGPETGVRIARKHLGWYSKRLPGGRVPRAGNRADDPRQVRRRRACCGSDADRTEARQVEAEAEPRPARRPASPPFGDLIRGGPERLAGAGAAGRSRDDDIVFVNAAGEQFLGSGRAALLPAACRMACCRRQPALRAGRQGAQEIGHSMTEYGRHLETPRIGEQLRHGRRRRRRDRGDVVVISLQEQSMAGKIDQDAHPSRRRALGHRRWRRCWPMRSRIRCPASAARRSCWRPAAAARTARTDPADREEADRIVRLVDRMEMFSD